MNHDLHDSIRDQAIASRQRLEDARVLLGLLGGAERCILPAMPWNVS